MKLVETPCDIKILTERQAWENYCNALHVSQTTIVPIDRHRFSWLAQLSLDQYFHKIEQKLPRRLRA
jgi:hypothetical protein